MIQPKFWKEVQEFKANHQVVAYQINSNVGVILQASNGDAITASLPYTNGFCIDPIKCAGLTCCPRNYACSE